MKGQRALRHRAPNPVPPPPPFNPLPDPFANLFNSDSEQTAAEMKAGKNVQPDIVIRRSDYTYSAWDKFLCRLPNRKSTAAKKIDEEKTAVEQTPGDGLQVEANAFHSWEQAANECRTKVAGIVAECERLNQKYRDPKFDLELNEFCVRSLDDKYPKSLPSDTTPIPTFVKRIEDVFDNPEFFVDGATASDVHQGGSGDCWFLAALMAVSAKRELIEERVCVARDTKVDVYGFVFYRDGEWIYEIVDGLVFVKVGDEEKLTLLKNWNEEKRTGSYVDFNDEKYEALKSQLQRGGEALYFSHCKSNETWLPLIEKAYAKAHGDYYSIEGGFTSEGIEDLTGGVGVIINSCDIMDKQKFWKDQLSQVNQKYLFGGSTTDSKKGILGSHAYAVLQTWEEDGLRLLKLRNPWGNCEWEGDWSDGSKLWTPTMLQKLDHTFGDDGVFWIAYNDFLKHFATINRVRLLSTEEWHVSQCWTCVNVPWAVDFLDTKFVFTITEKCSVVVVLCQPDDRYWWALRGRYFFALHFRIYKEDDLDGRWIVRSMHSSGAEPEFTRSVSAEIEDLDRGTYHVVFKVTAYRRKEAKTSEEAIMEYARTRKEKLLAVGRNFDYAQSKGNLRAMEHANKKRSGQESREYTKAKQKRSRKLKALENERAEKRRKRVSDAMREKRKAAEQERKEQLSSKAPNDSKEPQEDSLSEGRSESKPDNTPAGTEPSIKGEGDSKVAEEGENAENQPSRVGGEQSQIVSENTPKIAGRSIERSTDTFSPELRASAGRPDYRPTQEEQDALSKQFIRLDIRDRSMERRSMPRRRSVFSAPDDLYTSPVEPVRQLLDDDFEWDSDMDGAAYLSEDDDDVRVLRYNLRADNEIFAGDPWNAMCVLGLRVYAQNSTAKVSVIKGENSS